MGVPFSDKVVTYWKIFFDIKPNKEGKRFTPFTMCETLLECTCPLSTNIAYVTTSKYLFNSIINTP